jgi:ABC-2 type transport system permease protein
MRQLIKYFKLWLLLTKNSFLMVLVVRFSVVLFLIAKVIRFLLYYVFLVSLFSKLQSINGYQSSEIIFAFLTFTVIDTTVQLFFREVYRFRPLIISGDFDLVLTKPMNALFRALLGGADPIDLFLLIPFTAFLIMSMVRLPHTSGFSVVMYVTFLANSFLIATAFHILILSLTVVTSEIDHTIMIYRDLTSMGRVPVDIYKEPLRAIITFILPVGIMMTFPVKAYMQTLSFPLIVLSFSIGVGFFSLALFIWRRMLLSYASASS